MTATERPPRVRANCDGDEWPPASPPDVSEEMSGLAIGDVDSGEELVILGAAIDKAQQLVDDAIAYEQRRILELLACGDCGGLGEIPATFHTTARACGRCGGSGIRAEAALSEVDA